VTLLARPLTIGTIPDLEGLARATLCGYVKKSGCHLDNDDFDDLLAFLVAKGWERAVAWDRERNPSQRSYVAWKLRCDLIDEIRRRNGRAGEKLALRAGSLERARDDEDPLGGALAEGTGDPALDRSPDLGRLLVRRDRDDAAAEAHVIREGASGRDAVYRLMRELRAELEQLTAAA
jgi:hypothetical protein